MGTARGEQSVSERAASLLERWSRYAAARCVDQGPGLASFGSGFGGWGAQCNHCFLAAGLTLAERLPGSADAERLAGLAGEALAYELATHRTGHRSRCDATRWGHTWISVLGPERMMHALMPRWRRFPDATRDALERLIVSEADWLSGSYEKNGRVGIAGERWNGPANVPESNIWNGAFLWRATQLLPAAAEAPRWREQALRFLINGVSVASDAHDESVVDGARVCDRFVGDNFFPSLALDHHGYLNVGYMVICISNAAMLSLDLTRAGLELPEAIHRRQRELWSLVRLLTFENGRLARIGGDTRVAYAYCQDYLIPAALYAHRFLGDDDAMTVIDRQLEIYEAEATRLETDGFFGERLARLAGVNPFYVYRLESDRAVCLSMLLTHASTRLAAEKDSGADERGIGRRPARAITGSWLAPHHGAAVHRSERRLAAFSWRSAQRAQGTCLPPSRGDFASWGFNLAGRVEPLHHPRPTYTGDGPTRPSRRCEAFTFRRFDGGFATCGTIVEGESYEIAEGIRGRDAIRHRIAFAALPDDATVVGLQKADVGPAAIYLASARGMHLNVGNDVFNGYRRRLSLPNADRLVRADEAIIERLDAPRIQIDEELTVAGLYGADGFTLESHGRRTPDELPHHHAFHIHWGFEDGPRLAWPGETVLDVAWAVSCGVAAVSEDETCGRAVNFVDPGLRGALCPGRDGVAYAVVANFGSAAARAGLVAGDPDRLAAGTCGVFDLSRRARVDA